MALIQIKFYSPSLQTKTNIAVLLPTPESTLFGYQETFADCSQMGSFPVLYLLHGTSGDEADWLRFSRIEDYARKLQLVVVMPSCENSFYRDTPAGKAYYSYITEELPAFIQWVFPVSSEKKDTFLAGLSMGGSGAFVLGMSRPEQYGRVACLSGGFSREAPVKGSRWYWAFDPEVPVKHTKDDPWWLASQAAKRGKDNPEIYLCCGTEDPLYAKNREFAKHLESIGLNFTYHEQPGGHNWDFWDDEIRRILSWLPINNKMDTRYL